MTHSTTTEQLATVRARQVIWTTWMADATAGLADTDLVEVITDRTPFGNYVIDIRPVEANPADEWVVEPADVEAGIFLDTAWHAACPEAGGEAVAPVESLLGHEGEGHERHALVTYTFTCPGCNASLTTQRREWAPDDDELLV